MSSFIKYTRGDGEEVTLFTPSGMKRSALMGAHPDIDTIVEENYDDPADDDRNYVVTATDALQKLAAHRWAAETGGYTWNGWPVHSDDRAQFKALAEILRIQGGQRTDGDVWKFADGVFRGLDNVDFISMYQAGAVHIARCFACEAMCQARIAAGDYDIPAIWAEEWADLTAV